MKNYVNKIDRLNGFYIHSQYNPEFIEGARKLGGGVIALQGGFTSGGSMKNWDTRTAETVDTVAIIYHVPRQKALEVIDNLPYGVLEASIEGVETPAETDEGAISTARSLGAEFAKARASKLKKLLEERAAKEAEKHQVEDREAFVSQYIRAAFDVFREGYEG